MDIVNTKYGLSENIVTGAIVKLQGISLFAIM